MNTDLTTATNNWIGDFQPNGHNATNCIWPYPYYPTWPSQQSTIIYGGVCESYEIQIRKVQNGFVLKYQDQEFVFNSMKDMNKKLEEIYK